MPTHTLKPGKYVVIKSDDFFKTLGDIVREGEKEEEKMSKPVREARERLAGKIAQQLLNIKSTQIAVR